LDVDEFKKLHSSVKRFDIVGVTGFPGLRCYYVLVCLNSQIRSFFLFYFPSWVVFHGFHSSKVKGVSYPIIFIISTCNKENKCFCIRFKPVVPLSKCPGKSRTGELSIFPKTFIVLSHCLHMMPKQESAAAAADNANLMVNIISLCV